MVRSVCSTLNVCCVLDKPDESFGLTDVDADLIFSATEEDAMMEELKSELPADITDTILVVESEHQAALEQQKQQQQQQQQQRQQVMSASQHIPTNPHMLASPNYNMAASMSSSYNKPEFNAMQQYGVQGPPPEYPGSSKSLPPVTQLSRAHSLPMGYIHDHQASYHHPQSAKMAPVSQQHMMMTNSSYHMQSAPVSHPMGLPPSSTLLDNGHYQSSMGRMGGLPPVSTITMQQWHGPEQVYQNGYHHDHNMYMQQNGLPSPPQYHSSRDQRHVYAAPTAVYGNNPYSLNAPHPPPPQRLNMPLQ